MTDLNKIPEIKLWREVIKQALKDAGINYEKGNLAYIPGDNLSKEEKLARQQAIEFLTDTFGGWYRSRHIVCSKAMICPDQLRENTLQIFQTLKPTI